MADNYASYAPDLTTPGEYAFAITPNDSTDLANATRALYVGGAGDVACITVNGSTVTFVGMVAGMLYPLRLKRVLSTGTSASSLVGVY